MSKNTKKTERRVRKEESSSTNDIFSVLKCKLNGQCWKCTRGCTINPSKKSEAPKEYHQKKYNNYQNSKYQKNSNNTGNNQYKSNYKPNNYYNKNKES